jgi:predicted metal-dependent phosphoesterase TrpH
MSTDLHTHTCLSDGALSPTQLIERAIANGVGHLSITDHDTTAAYQELPDYTAHDLVITPGIELSTRWMKVGIHIVGLNIDPNHDTLLSGIEIQRKARLDRAQQIARRLEKCGIPDSLPGAMKNAGVGCIGRPHFAKFLVDEGYSKDFPAAFRKYLGNGKPGDVRDVWPPIEEVIRWIKAAGGTAVLAHPYKYKLTATKLRELTRDFCSAGGESIEVVSGSQRPEITSKIADLADAFGLSASCGSDFHDPAHRWSDVGRFSPLPESVTPVWEQWETTPRFA